MRWQGAGVGLTKDLFQVIVNGCNSVPKTEGTNEEGELRQIS